MFYLKSKRGIRDITNKECETLLRGSEYPTIGINDYSIEFNWDGSFLYPIDRDYRDREDFKRIDTLEEMSNILLSHGTQIIKAFEALKEMGIEIHISDSLNSHDYPLALVFEELQKLEKNVA